MAAIRSVTSVYFKLMEKHPFRMQIIQSGLLMGTGDFIAQKFIESKELRDVNWSRTLRYFGVGFLIVGPTISRWYLVLERLFGRNGFKTVLKKISVDQLVFAPCFIPVIVSAVSIMDGSSIADIKDKLQNDYWDILLTNYKIWPAVQVVNFYFIPLNYRVICTQVVALGWNTYLSWKLSRNVVDDDIGKKSELKLL